jgi:phospholipid/cholesterol/gamma-HCH transport system substrate-binding protein
MPVTLSRTHRVRWAGVLLNCATCATAVSLLTGAWAPPRQEQYVHYCAIMPDSVGLYVGNPVTQMGSKIGEISTITPALKDVRVDFKVIRNRPLPADVRAVTRSASILADRALELVGNHKSGSQLSGGTCIPLSRSSTPKSLSEIIGSATNFLNAINPDGSTNISGVVTGLDRALRGNGPGINMLLNTSSAVLDAPDQGISDIRSIITNLAELTSALREVTGPLKDSLLASYQTTADVDKGTYGGKAIFNGVIELVNAVSDLEIFLGDEFQTVYNDLEYALRKVSAHATLFASLLKPYPVLINWLERHANDKQFFTIRYRPPLYRIATPVNGLITCGAMNAASPGSCTDVAGKPYAVDVALLQYILTQAAHP